GRGQRDPAEPEPQADRLLARLLGRLVPAPPDEVLGAGALDVPSLRRPGARLEGHGLQGTGRLVLGGAVLAARAAQLRADALGAASGLGASPVALDGRDAGALDQRRLVVPQVRAPVRVLYV